jgi:Domain of unknown function (DUF4331)
MSHHYSGPNIGFPRGDARLDLTDVYAFPKPGEAGKSTLIMNVHPSVGLNPPGPTTSEHFAPEARYEVKIDTDGDAVDNITYEVRFASVAGGEQTACSIVLEVPNFLLGPKAVGLWARTLIQHTAREGDGSKRIAGRGPTKLPFLPASRTTLTSPGSLRTMHVSFLSSRTLWNTQAGIHRKKQSGGCKTAAGPLALRSQTSSVLPGQRPGAHRRRF